MTRPSTPNRARDAWSPVVAGVLWGLATMVVGIMVVAAVAFGSHMRHAEAWADRGAEGAVNLGLLVGLIRGWYRYRELAREGRIRWFR